MRDIECVARSQDAGTLVVCVMWPAMFFMGVVVMVIDIHVCTLCCMYKTRGGWTRSRDHSSFVRT